MAGVGDWGRSMNPREKAGRRRWKGRCRRGGGTERSVRHEGATRRTVDVRGDGLGAAGHSTLATPIAYAIPFYSNVVDDEERESVIFIHIKFSKL